MQPNLLAVVAADVGAVPTVSDSRFAWWSSEDACGVQPSTLADHVAQLLANGRPVALGSVCPLFVPLRKNEHALTNARPENVRQDDGLRLGVAAAVQARSPWDRRKFPECYIAFGRARPLTPLPFSIGKPSAITGGACSYEKRSSRGPIKSAPIRSIATPLPKLHPWLGCEDDFQSPPGKPTKEHTRESME